jgi:hypothetical protein
MQRSDASRHSIDSYTRPEYSEFIPVGGAHRPPSVMGTVGAEERQRRSHLSGGNWAAIGEGAEKKEVIQWRVTLR